MKIGIMLPVRNREQILKYTLDYINKIEYDHKKIGIRFYVNDSVDDTLNVVEDFCYLHAEEYYKLDYIKNDFGMPCEKDRRLRRQNGIIQHMAILKNILFNSMKDEGYDFLFFMDSDLFLPSNIFNNIKLYKESGINIMGFMVDTTNQNHMNYFYYDKKFNNYSRSWKHPDRIFSCDYICGCFLIRNKIFDLVEFGFQNQLGDDDLFMEILRKKNIPIWMNPQIKPYHVYDINKFLMEKKNE